MIDVTAIKVGTRLKLQEGVVAEVVENMDDGQWLQVRYLEVPARPGDVGLVELCHAQDVVKVLSE
ncbi:hypothetical protein IC762_26160 [Bradyrhizobium genosp. L]|uniref:hypothetical protein n=1 Tax=Bradyrhizobium genosp. L TaxID=83637 RepID=UPI0018A30A8C|nr:hypothetical protein [Bradyrhizobium genosp. L]QPF83181.1 hypothetical protein IC762_26160 [Bradyrhizobium genosp. L]